MTARDSERFENHDGVTAPWAVFVVLCALCWTCLPARASTGPSLGDLDGDGRLTKNDVTLLDEMLSGTRPAEWLVADVDLDEIVSNEDRYLLDLYVTQTGPVVGVLGRLLGREKRTAGKLSALLSHDERLNALNLLIGYLERGGGLRTVKPNEPGGDVVPRPRAACLELVVALFEAEAAPDTARKGALETLFHRSVSALERHQGGMTKDRLEGWRKRLLATAEALGFEAGAEEEALSDPLFYGLLGVALVSGLVVVPLLLLRPPKRPLRRRPRPNLLEQRLVPKSITGVEIGRARSVLPERYKIGRNLGRGGQGTVLKAFDTSLKRTVAIKVLDTSQADMAHMARFLREAETLANLEHPGLPKIYDLQPLPKPYIVMQFIEGTDLREMLTDGPPSLEKALSWAMRLFHILEHCHASGVLHRDVKPGNIIINEHGALFLVDFGFVRPVAGERITIEGDVVGTVGYLAPELFDDQDNSVRSDIYSAGLVTYEMVTGEYAYSEVHPFPPQIFHEPDPPQATVPELPGDLCVLLLQMIERSPEKRPESAREIISRLRGIFPRTSGAHPAPEVE